MYPWFLSWKISAGTRQYPLEHRMNLLNVNLQPKNRRTWQLYKTKREAPSLFKDILHGSANPGQILSIETTGLKNITSGNFIHLSWDRDYMVCDQQTYSVNENKLLLQFPVTGQTNESFDSRTTKSTCTNGWLCNAEIRWSQLVQVILKNLRLKHFSKSNNGSKHNFQQLKNCLGHESHQNTTTILMITLF